MLGGGEMKESLRVKNPMKMAQPSNMGGHNYNMGLKEMMNGNLDRAIEYFNRVNESDPEFIPAWVEKGNCLDARCRYEEALRCYDHAIEMDPCNGDVWFNKGLTLKRMGLAEKSRECMDRTMRLALF